MTGDASPYAVVPTRPNPSRVKAAMHATRFNSTHILDIAAHLQQRRAQSSSQPIPVPCPAISVGLRCVPGSADALAGSMAVTPNRTGSQSLRIASSSRPIRHVERTTVSGCGRVDQPSLPRSGLPHRKSQPHTGRATGDGEAQHGSYRRVCAGRCTHGDVSARTNARLPPIVERSGGRVSLQARRGSPGQKACPRVPLFPHGAGAALIASASAPDGLSSRQVGKKRPQKASSSGSGLTVTHGPRGRGVSATRRFAKGEVIEACPTVEVAEGDVTGRLNDYVFASVTDGDVLLVLGYGMLYNHSPNPNVQYVQDDP